MNKSMLRNMLPDELERYLIFGTVEGPAFSSKRTRDIVLQMLENAQQQEMDLELEHEEKCTAYKVSVTESALEKLKELQDIVKSELVGKMTVREVKDSKRILLDKIKELIGYIEDEDIT